jgi:hypothetical protein
MKTVRFVYNEGGNRITGYRCSEPGEMSGEYVPAATAQALVDACRQCLVHIEADEMTHGRPFAAGNSTRAALALTEE